MSGIWLAGCGASRDTAQTTGLANSGSGRNAALLVGAPHNLAGVPTDIREFGNLLRDQQYDFRFPAITANGNATAAEIIRMSGEAARDADSLIWFFSGHGNTGVLLAKDRTFTFHEVAASIRAARSNVPLKRLLVFIDSCYAGSFVNGREPIIEQVGGTTQRLCKRGPETEATAVESVFDTFEAMDQGVFDEAFVLASSTKDESSVDLGAEKGGAFTWSLRQEMVTLKRTRDNATLDEFAQATSRRTLREGGHTPVWKAYPSNQILAEKLFKYAQ